MLNRVGYGGGLRCMQLWRKDDAHGIILGIAFYLHLEFMESCFNLCKNSQIILFQLQQYLRFTACKNTYGLES